MKEETRDTLLILISNMLIHLTTNHKKSLRQDIKKDIEDVTQKAIDEMISKYGAIC